MTGVFPANVIAGAQAVTGTDGPPSVNALAGAQAPAASITGGQFAIPFYQQEGLTRYAPMQTYPPSKITKKTKTPLNPKSPWNVATTYLAQPTVLTTVTMPVTWSFSQAEHTVRIRKRRLYRRRLTRHRYLLLQCRRMTCKSS
jgi:hypothetical protein